MIYNQFASCAGWFDELGRTCVVSHSKLPFTQTCKTARCINVINLFKCLFCLVSMPCRPTEMYLAKCKQSQ